MLKNKTRSLYSGGQRPPERRALEAEAVFGVKVQHGACRCLQKTTPLPPTRHHSHYTHRAMSAITSNVHFSEFAT